MLEVESLSKKFGKKEVLRTISYSFENGVYGLLGPNGAGKTTFIRCLLDLYTHTGECILSNGEGGNEIKKEKVGYLPQRNQVFPGLTVKEQLHYFANMKNMEKSRISEEIERVLEMVNLQDYINVKGRKLSGGMIRRLGIAQALLNAPQLVIFDEPTTGLDPEERMRFKNIVKKLGREAIVIMSTHIVSDVEAVCNHILIMQDGSIVADGTQSEISSFADGKVYEIPRAAVSLSAYIEKEIFVDETEFVRILTTEPVAVLPSNPTIEDGYLCILNKI